MTERNEQQKAADKFRESLRERIQRLPTGVTVEVWTSASTTSGNLPYDKQTLREVGVGRLPEVRMLAARISADRDGYADLVVGARPVRVLFAINVDEVELRGAALEEGQNEWPGMMDDVRRWVRGVTADELIRADQEGWARTVEWESAREGWVKADDDVEINVTINHGNSADAARAFEKAISAHGTKAVPS